MLINRFTFQAERIFPITFTPVIETQVGEGDDAFISDYPKRILLSGDLELVPWMVGITSREGGLFPTCETIFLHKTNYYIFLIMESNFSSLLKRHVIRARPELVQYTADQYSIVLDPVSSLLRPCHPNFPFFIIFPPSGGV
jgi:hypothetical protein